MHIQEKCAEAYEKHKHLKLAANDVGIPWQTVYVHLKRAGIAVTGDKLRYGSDTDKLAARAELLFSTLVPDAINCNAKKFQSKVDFVVNGHSVDVKSSRLQEKNGKPTRLAFSLKKQELLADFFVCFGFVDDKSSHCLLIPSEIAKNYQTMSVSITNRSSKWWDYEIDKNDLADFFNSLGSKSF